jgi:hypothetical protein
MVNPGHFGSDSQSSHSWLDDKNSVTAGQIPISSPSKPPYLKEIVS